jgi:hypothetical protein
MVTAVDTSVLLDVLLNDPRHSGPSISTLARPSCFRSPCIGGQNLSLEPVPPCLQRVMPNLKGTGNTLLCARFGYGKRISTRAKSFRIVRHRKRQGQPKDKSFRLLLGAIRIPVPNPVREPNRCDLEPFKPETPKIALYVVVMRGLLTLQLVWLGLTHFQLPVRPPKAPSPPTDENPGRPWGTGREIPLDGAGVFIAQKHDNLTNRPLSFRITPAKQYRLQLHVTTNKGERWRRALSARICKRRRPAAIRSTEKLTTVP